MKSLEGFRNACPFWPECLKCKSQMYNLIEDPEGCVELKQTTETQVHKKRDFSFIPLLRAINLDTVKSDNIKNTLWQRKSSSSSLEYLASWKEANVK